MAPCAALRTPALRSSDITTDRVVVIRLRIAQADDEFHLFFLHRLICISITHGQILAGLHVIRSHFPRRRVTFELQAASRNGCPWLRRADAARALSEPRAIGDPADAHSSEIRRSSERIN